MVLVQSSNFVGWCWKAVGLRLGRFEIRGVGLVRIRGVGLDQRVRGASVGLRLGGYQTRLRGVRLDQAVYEV